VLTLAALVRARAGDLKQAKAQSEMLNSQYPADTIVQEYWLPTIRAELAIREGKSWRAVDALKVAESIEVAAPSFSVAALDPAYARGEAYLAAGDGQSALAQFQKITGQPGLMLNSPLGPLARLGVARAYSRANNPAKARDAYRDFFQLWKDADPDIPILKQAQAEYAKLSEAM